MPGDSPNAIEAEQTRAQRIIARVLSLPEDDLSAEYSRLLTVLCGRHRDVEKVFLQRYENTRELLGGGFSASGTRAKLIGAYFSEEYSYQSAALFNPSIVMHPEQSGCAPGSLRFILSLRAIGEGHLSSIAFRTGSWRPGGDIVLDAASRLAATPRIEFPETEDGVVHLHCEDSHDLSETVLFPILERQRGGIEDLRLTRMHREDGSMLFAGTYTAVGSHGIAQELLTTSNFVDFKMHRLQGPIAASKGMALFPRLIEGRYAMLGRHDNENIWLLLSDDLHRWDGGVRIVDPQWTWEFTQLGNCGSPIETAHGWLVFTHGVGAMREYCIGACLLDRSDPSRVIARTREPLLRPSPEERDGYVPNVVYSCGALLSDNEILLPYGVADSFTAFSTLSLDALLTAME